VKEGWTWRRGGYRFIQPKSFRRVGRKEKASDWVVTLLSTGKGKRAGKKETRGYGARPTGLVTGGITKKGEEAGRPCCKKAGAPQSSTKR